MNTPDDYARLFCDGLARRIFELRRENGLTLYALAKLARVKLDRVARIERGIHRMKITTAALIFHAFGQKLGDEMDALEREIFGPADAGDGYSPKRD